jgi:hypothetical protein
MAFRMRVIKEPETLTLVMGEVKPMRPLHSQRHDASSVTDSDLGQLHKPRPNGASY